MLDFELTPAHFTALEFLIVTLAVLILVSSLDDLFFDVVYWKERLRRRRAGGQDTRPLPEGWASEAEQPLAIMVPAWQESDVIASMVENLVATLNYRNFHVFIGTYPNDAATIAEVERMSRRYPHVHRVQVRHPGPTCKADCLNAVIMTILAHEKSTGTRFAGVILHDSEDVLNPLELKYFNHLLPRHDMVQLPVISLPRKWNEWVAGTYMDEFAESHKEMLVREHLTGSVPSAGVGTCFSHRALMALAEATRGEPFNTASLTEDYEIGMRLAALGMKSTFGWLPLTDNATGEVKPLSVEEFFPSKFRAAVRQKSRWALGIGLQSWGQVGWRGRPAAMKYVLLHDRKGIVTAFVAVAAYVVLAVMLVIRSQIGEGWAYPDFSGVTTSPWFYGLLLLNLSFLLVRLAERFYFTTRLYGWKQGLLSWPRMVVGNFVNCFATARAWRLYLGHLVHGRKLSWDKTSHDFPTAAELGRERSLLGDLLVSWQALGKEDLEHALSRQKSSGQRLGKVLVGQGLIDEEMLADAVAYQSNLARGTVSPVHSRACRRRVPNRLALHRNFLPLAIIDDKDLLVGVSAPLSQDALDEIGRVTGLVPSQRILRDNELEASLEFLFHDEPGADRHVAEGQKVA